MTEQRSNATVLLVDDEPDIRVLWRTAIARDGRFGSVHEASGGHEGLEMLGAHRPDVVVTDYSMPGLCGFKLLEAVRALRPEVVLIMASSAVGISDEALRRGADAFLGKYDSTTKRLPELIHRHLLDQSGHGASELSRV